jgi:LysM repeat protein
VLKTGFKIEDSVINFNRKKWHNKFQGERKMKKRDTIFLVVLAHVGLVLIWVTMGGCSFTRSRDKSDEIEVGQVDVPAEEELIIPDSDSGLIINDSGPLIVDEQTSGPGTPMTTAGETEYVVQKGDTLWGISRKYRVSTSNLKARNQLKGDIIRAGDVLIIPTGSGAVVAPAPIQPIAPIAESTPETAVEEAGTEAVEATVEEAVTETGTPEYIEHAVVSGDTLWKLARQYNTTETKIMELNNITDPKRIQIGQKLKIPKN